MYITHIRTPVYICINATKHTWTDICKLCRHAYISNTNITHIRTVLTYTKTCKHIQTYTDTLGHTHSHPDRRVIIIA